MSTDYATATGQPRSMMLAGKEYRVAKFTPKLVGKLDAWLKDKFPNPLVEAREHMVALRDCPAEVQKHVWDCALEAKSRWPFRHNSPEGSDLLFNSVEGLTEFVGVLLREHQPEITAEAIAEIVGSLSPDGPELARLLELAGPGEVGDPKSPTPEATATP